MDTYIHDTSGDSDTWDERVSAVAPLFGDDSLAPVDFLEVSRRRTHLQPEKKLMFAMLNDAVYCFQHYIDARQRARRKLFIYAEQWIRETGGQNLYAFDNVCEHLGIDPDYLRRGLLRWQQQRGSLSQWPAAVNQ